MGFTLQGFSPERSRTCFQAVALLSLRKPLPSFSSEEEKETRGVDRLQSFAPRSDPYPPNSPKAAQRADALLRFCLPRVFSPCNRWGQAPNSNALQTPRSPRRGPGVPRRPVPRSITNCRIGWPLSRLPTLPRFLTLSVDSTIWTARARAVCISRRR